jgi:hypothetical protein
MAQSIQPEMCICRENLEAKVVTLAFTIFYVERNAGLAMVPKARRSSLSPHPLVPPPSALWLVENQNFNFNRPNRRRCETTLPITEIAAVQVILMVC